MSPKIYKVEFEEALNMTGYSRYNFHMFLLCASIVIAMSFEIFGVAYLVPASACELQTTPTQQGLLACVPLAGIIFTSTIWGYLADTKGRKKILMISMTMGFVAGTCAAFSTHWIMLSVFKLFSSASMAGAFALCITILGECTPMAKRSGLVILCTSIFLMASGLMAALSLKEEEMAKSSTWLDLVFSLLTLDKATPEHLASTLQAEFIDKLLSAGEIPIPSRRKLMMIDAYLHLTHPHAPRLPVDISVGVPVVYTKEKAFYVTSIMDTFKSLVSSDAFLKKECNSGMGFLYDAEFAVDAKCHPVPLEKAVNNKSVYRIAVLGLDYHDMTRKTPAPLGVNQLYTRLLRLKGYKVLQIPYTDFNSKDKLVTRVQYIEKRLKDVLSNTT